MTEYINGAEVLDAPIIVNSETLKGNLQFDALLGGEQVTNGTPASATGWTLGADWAYGSSLFTKAVASGTSTVSQATTVGVVGDVVKITYKISAGMAGTSVTMSFGGVTGTARTAAGTYTEYLTATSTAALTFTPTADFVGSISLISVKRVAVTATDRVTMWSGDRIASGVEAAGDAGLFIRSEDGTMSFLGDQVGFGTPQPSTLVEIQGGLTTTGAILTLGSKETSTVANDVLGRINFYAPLDASGTDANLVAASIVALAEGTFSSSNNATSLLLQTGASETATTKMIIKSDGKVQIGTTTTSGLLNVGGDIYTTSGAIGNSDSGDLILYGAVNAGTSGKGILLKYAYNSGGNWTNALLVLNVASADSAVAILDIPSVGTVNVGVGKLLINTNNTVAAYSDNGEMLEVNKSADDGGIGLFCWSTTDAERPLIEFHKSSSATIGTKAIVAANEAIGGIIWRAAEDSSDWRSAASIEAYIDGTPGASSDMPGRIVISTTPDGSATPTEALRIDSAQMVQCLAGNVKIANATDGGTAGLHIRSKRAVSAAMTSGTTANIAVQIPSGAMILGAQFNVDTLITGATSWAAAFNTGSTTALVTGQAVAKDTKANKMIVPELATAATDITITGSGGDFTAGVIEALVYYCDFTSMANA